MHPARADDEIWSVSQDQGGEIGVVGFPGLGTDFLRGGGGRVGFGVGEDVVVVGGDRGGGGALEAFGGFAVGYDAGDCGVGEGWGGGGGGGGVDEGLEVGAVSGARGGLLEWDG